MKDELSLAELESEMAAELPARRLMWRHRYHSHHYSHHHGTSANNGSVANSNHTSQRIFNPQVAINFGGGAIGQVGNNTNTNSNLQFGIPING